MMAGNMEVQSTKSLPVQKAKGISYLMRNLGKKPKKYQHFPISATELYLSLLKRASSRQSSLSQSSIF